MKTLELIEVELEQPMTSLELSLQQHATAVLSLSEHRESMKQLRTRIEELREAIREVNVEAAKSPSMASMSIEDIRALSASKNSRYAELAGLNAALDVGIAELKNLESDERGLRLFVADSATGAWATLYRQLFQALNIDAVRQLATAALMGGLNRSMFVEELLGGEGLDAQIAEGLSEHFGLPL